MQYVILSYCKEAESEALTADQDRALMADLAAVRQELAVQGKLGPVSRLMPTTAATTVRHDRETLVLDGPFAETKEQLLGFYIVDCERLEDVIDVARRLAVPRIAAGISGALEIRPLQTFHLQGVTK